MVYYIDFCSKGNKNIQKKEKKKWLNFRHRVYEGLCYFLQDSRQQSDVYEVLCGSSCFLIHEIILK
jgi:hypothetical protein